MKFSLFLLIAFCSITKLQAQITSVADGNWSDGNTWSGGVVPAATDNVIITNSNAVMLDADASCASLTVGTGGFVTLTYSGVGVALTVSGDVTIEGNSVIQTAPGAGLNNHLNIGGNLVNRGSLFCTFADQNGILKDQNTITFTSAANTAFSTVAGSTNFLGPVIINKGTDTTSIFSFNLAAPGTSTLGSRYSLTLVSGTCKATGNAVTSIGPINGNTIATNCRLWLANPNLTTSWTGLTNLNGALQADAGTLNLGTVMGTGAVVINGGTVNCTGSFNIAGMYTQSAGTVTVATSSNTANGIASFGVSGNSFIMSGGNIIIQKPATGISSSDYNVSSTNTTITGGLVQLGNEQSGLLSIFKIQGTTPTLTLFPGAVNVSLATSGMQSGPLTIKGDFIMPGTAFGIASFTKGNFPLTMAGCSVNNPGNIFIAAGNSPFQFIINSSAVASNAISFTSSFSDQRVINNGIINTNGADNNELPSIIINNTFPGGQVTFPPGLSMLSGTTLALITGTLRAGASLGLGTAAPGTFTCIRTNGALAATTVAFGSGLTSTDYTYNGTTHTSMGPELTTAANPSISFLKIDNTQGVTLNSDLTVTVGLTLTNGIIDNSGNHKLSITNDRSAAVIGGSATEFLNGGTMERSQNSTAGNSYFYPVGGANKFRPVYLINGAVTGSNTFDVSYHSGAPASLAVTNNPYHVSTKDNWDIHRALPAGGADPMEVRLTTNNNAASGIVDRNTVVVGHFNGNTWDNLPAQTNTGFVDETGSEIIATNVTSFSPFSFMSNVLANTLPIIVRSFEVSAINKNAAQLNWSIETTSGAAVYIQHGIDGTQYTNIAHFNNGNDNTSFIDFNPSNGINYYRLKLVEPSGDIIYSIVKKIQFNTQSVMLYPNPAVNSIKISSLNWLVPATITIVNSTGNIVYKAKTTDSQQTIDVSRFAVGQYILNYSQGDAVKHVSFVIVR